MTETHSDLALPGSAVWMLKSLEGSLRDLATRITDKVVADLPPSASDDHSWHELTFVAIHNATLLFVDQALGRPVRQSAVDDHFRKLGYRQGVFGLDQGTIQDGFRIAIKEVGDELRVRAADNELSAGALNALNEAINTYISHLDRQVEIGYHAGAEARDQDQDVARHRLMERLLSGADLDEIESQAMIAEWPLGERLTVLAVQGRKGSPVHLDETQPRALVNSRTTPQAVVCAADDTDEIVAILSGQESCSKVIVCWPVPPRDVAAAWTWVNRARELARSKLIPNRKIIDCARHRTEIWLHSEPVLRRHLAQELLQPLFTETENSRDILSETLLVWLETRESAPAIAARLGVHPQTVRYRWKRINELFGDDLLDPEFVLQMTMLLKASVPLWLAGDRSDFERFQAGVSR